MSNIELIEQTGTEAVRELRKQTLADGHPFMINSNDLPNSQCYLEYPNGSIHLVSLSENKRDFDLIRKLSIKEAKALRSKFNLSE